MDSSATLDHQTAIEDQPIGPAGLEPKLRQGCRSHGNHFKQLTSSDIGVANCAHLAGTIKSLRELGYALANSLCNQFQCESVGVGIVRSGNIHVIAISGCANFKPGSPGVVEMRQAMEESLDQCEVVVYPSGSSQTAFPIHRRWSIGSGGSQVCSVPLLVGDDAVGVISLRRTEALPFTTQVLELLDSTIAPFGTLLSLVDRANQPLARHLRDCMRSWRNAQRSPLRIAATILLVVATGWFFLGKTPYRPLCDSVVVAASLRNMTSPFESRLERVHVHAGDEVKSGDVLAVFDTDQMKLELETIRAEVARTEVNERAAIEASDASAAALQRAHVRVLLARQAGLERRVRSAQLTAPANGMIIQSNCDKRLGQVFRQGDPVLQFAPHDGWILNIHVPEDAAIYVQPDQLGSFASTARPNEKVCFRIEQTNGSAEVIDGRNVFVARADLEDSPSWMRSGMQGIALVNTQSRPVWWVTLHKVVDWTRLRFWL